MAARVSGSRTSTWASSFWVSTICPEANRRPPARNLASPREMVYMGTSLPSRLLMELVKARSAVMRVV